jgi:acetoin:2,6-dichlorophenolindophenol oxidoreductase subunit alpha
MKTTTHPPTTDHPSETTLQWMYERMSLIRRFEERLKWLVETGVPVGAVHYYTGQEAVAAGVCAALEPQDWMASTHRGHGHCIAKGVEVARMMAELFGKATGTNHGKGGSMHITDINKRVLGVNPIVGAGVAHAVGAGLSAKVRGANEVVVTFFGDGAGAIGTLHEALNMASIWQLPVIFVCENNGYAQATPVEYALCSPDVAERAPAYHMPGLTVDGQDVVAVWRAADEAVRRARSGGGPSLIECKTYRYYGHHQGDETLRYRTADEEQAARERDCLERFRQQMQAAGPLTLAQLDEIDARNDQLLDEAVEFAEASPLPDPGELYTDVYVGDSRPGRA